MTRRRPPGPGRTLFDDEGHPLRCFFCGTALTSPPMKIPTGIEDTNGLFCGVQYVRVCLRCARAHMNRVTGFLRRRRLGIPYVVHVMRVLGNTIGTAIEAIGGRHVRH